MSSKNQSQSYTVTAEGTDLSTDVLLIDGDRLQVELARDSATESGSNVLVLWSCGSDMIALPDCCIRCQEKFQCVLCTFIAGFVASAVVPLLFPGNFSMLPMPLFSTWCWVWPYHASQSVRKVSSWGMPGDTALPQTATMKTSNCLWYCGIIRLWCQYTKFDNVSE